jgi:outer membrane protein assembly factor BamB
MHNKDKHPMTSYRSIRNVVILGGLLLPALTAGAGNWERFRGPNGTGTVPDKDVPVKWTEANILWKAAIPGQASHSSPVVWGARLFLQTSSADASQRSLLCYDTTTGKLFWSRSVPAAVGKINSRNSLASCTPATDGEQVYVLFWDGKEISLHAFNFKGDTVWKRDLGPFKSQHGPGHSPIVYDGKVILANDQDGKAVLLAFDTRTGKTVWEAERKAYRASYATPFINDRADGSKELIVASTAGISGYDPANGKEFWNCALTFQGMPLRIVASPVAANGLVFAACGAGEGGRLQVAVKLGGKGDVTQTHLAWENRKSFPYVPTLLTHGDHLYSVTDLGQAACHVAATGEEVWSHRLNSPVTGSPVLIDGKVYVVAEDGKVFVLEAATKYKLLATNLIGEPVSSTPAVADNRLYIRGQDHLFCIGKPARK